MAARKARPGADGRSKPRPGQAEQKRALVDAAVEVFAERGSRNVSISQICEAADVSRDTFYRCFDDKAALIDEIWERAANRPIESIVFDALPTDEPVGAWLDRTIDTLLDAVFAEAKLAHFAFVEYGDLGSLAHQAISVMFDSYAQKLQAWLREQYRVEPSRLLLESMMAGVQWILLETLRAGVDDVSRRDAKAAVVQLVGGVFAAIQQLPEVER